MTHTTYSVDVYNLTITALLSFRGAATMGEIYARILANVDLGDPDDDLRSDLADCLDQLVQEQLAHKFDSGRHVAYFPAKGLGEKK